MKKQTAESFANLETLQLRARTLVESVLTGTHRGNQKGFSVDFSEHRDYSPGDDVRFIDWKLLGKRDRFYIRQFEDENQLQAWLLVDTSGSMLYRSQDSHLSKLDYAATLASAIGWVACYQRDQAALLAFDSHEFTQTGPIYGHAGAKRFIERLDELTQQAKMSSQKSIEEKDQFIGLASAAEKVPRNSVVCVLTDAFGDPDRLKRILSSLQHKNCDLRLLHVLDAAEFQFPFTGSMLFKGLEGGEFQTQSHAIREEYIKEFELFLMETRRLCRQTNCQYWVANTEEPLDMLLRQFLNSRKQA